MSRQSPRPPKPVPILIKILLDTYLSREDKEDELAWGCECLGG